MDNPFAGAGKAQIVRRLPPDVPSTTVDDYVADAWAKATSVAPCIATADFPPDDKPEKEAELTAILRGIILRWHEAQSGVKTTQQAGPFQQTVDPGPKRGFNLWPSEVVDLGKLCQRSGRPFTVDTLPDDFEIKPPLYGVVVNGSTEGLHGPPGEWSDEV
jgi:hypothetical protein